MIPVIYKIFRITGASLVLRGKESTCNAGDLGLIPGSGSPPSPPREGNDNPPQYYCLGNFMDRQVWQAIVHGVTKERDMSLVTKQHLEELNTHGSRK